MKKFYYHIGSEKCASTRIESTFLGSPDIREYMDKCSITSLQKFHLEFRETQPFDEWRRVHEALRQRYVVPELTGSNDAVFCSEEAILGLSHRHEKGNQCRRRAAFLERIVDGFDPMLIILLRRQDGFIESMYNQEVKRGEMRSFKDYFDALPLENYEWDKVVDAFEAVFGMDRIKVFPFDRNVLGSRPGGPTNVLNAIAGVIKLGVNFDLSKAPVMNPSLPRRFIPVQIKANETLEREEAATVADVLSMRFPKAPDEKLGLIKPAARKKLLARYRRSNERLFARYLPDYDPQPFLSDEQTGGKPPRK